MERSIQGDREDKVIAFLVAQARHSTSNIRVPGLSSMGYYAITDRYFKRRSIRMRLLGTEKRVFRPKR